MSQVFYPLANSEATFGKLYILAVYIERTLEWKYYYTTCHATDNSSPSNLIETFAFIGFLCLTFKLLEIHCFGLPSQPEYLQIALATDEQQSEFLAATLTAESYWIREWRRKLKTKLT